MRNIEHWLRDRGYIESLTKGQAAWLIESWNNEVPELRKHILQHMYWDLFKGEYEDGSMVFPDPETYTLLVET